MSWCSSHILPTCGCFYQPWGASTHLRELADTVFASVQNFVKLGLYLKNWYDKQQASWEVKILKFKNWICLRKLHRSGLDLLPLFQVLPSPAMVFTLIFCNSCPQNLRSFVNLLPKLDFTKFWRNTNCLCANSLTLPVVESNFKTTRAGPGRNRYQLLVFQVYK